MAITLVNAGTVAENTVAATTLNVPYPTGLAANDLLVLGFSQSLATTTPNAQTGFTTVDAFASSVIPGNYLGIKFATGSESGNFAVSTSNNTSWGQMLAFRGVDGTNTQDVTSVRRDQTTAATTINLTATTSMTTTRPNVCLVYMVGQNATANSASPPTAPAVFTETGDRVAGTRNGTMGYLIWTGSGSVGSPTVTFTGSARSSGFLMALRPSDLPMLVMPPRN